MDATLATFADTIRRATETRTALQLRGGGTKDFYGETPRGETLDTTGYRGIVEYDPTELVITARCGTPLSEVEAALAGSGQMLAFEPPHFGAAATLGGCIAAGLSGPRRQSAGALRDFVLGAALINGKGEPMTFGGRVMKNVAGYDVARLMAGSLGTLGLILEVSIKVLPRPAGETSFAFDMDQTTAIEMLNQWAGAPLPISASAWSEGRLTLRVSGAAPVIEAAAARLTKESAARRLDSEAAQQFWTAVREQSAPFFDGDVPLWRLSVPSTTAPIPLEGAQLLEWGGALRWLRSDADARTIRDAAARAGGHATLFRARKKLAGAFHPLSPAVFKIHRSLKTEFDPAGVFNPGRMYADL